MVLSRWIAVAAALAVLVPVPAHADSGHREDHGTAMASQVAWPMHVNGIVLTFTSASRVLRASYIMNCSRPPRYRGQSVFRTFSLHLPVTGKKLIWLHPWKGSQCYVYVDARTTAKRGVAVAIGWF
jgi:hypothetical protein